MYFADLSPYSYHGDPELESLNVGWLDKARGYPRGPVPAIRVDRAGVGG